MNKLISAACAVARIKDNDVVTVSSSSALGCPDKVLAALEERFNETASPRNLTMLNPIAAGDMYGVKGIDHVAREGLIATVIAGSYPSGPSSLPMPAIWKMITENRVAAYNVPSGILFDMHKDVAARRPGVLTKVGLGTFVDPHQQGCAMNASAMAKPIVKRVEFAGDTWLHFANIVPNVCILRATTADEAGNLTYEHEGAILGGLEQAIAVRNHGGIVIAQVKRMTASGSLRPHDVRVPSHLVDFLVLDPQQKQTTETDYDPAISGEVMQPWQYFDIPKISIEKVIARRAAFELKRGQAANLGFGISAMIPRILLEEGQQNAITWVIEQGACGGMPLTGFAFGCASNADAFMPSPAQFTYFQGGGFDVSFLSFMEIDIQGNVNVSKLAKKPYLTAGCGGFVDITSHAGKIVFCGWFEAGAALAMTSQGISVQSPGKFTKMVEAVEHVSFSGTRAISNHQEVIYITERCVMRLTDDGLEAIEIMPGMDVQQDIIEASQGRVRISPTAKTMPLALLAEQPMGMSL